MPLETKHVGKHRVIYDGSLVEEIIINQPAVDASLRLRDILHQLEQKAEIARHNMNEVYPTAQTFEAREYVAELENSVEHLKRALQFKQSYIKYVHGHTYTDDMILTKEEIN